MIWSPNAVWLSIAVSLHMFAPYDYEAAKEGFAAGWLLKRFALNYTVAFIYYGFFYVGLYWMNLASRKFAPDSFPTFGNMMHNLYYWSLAIVQWTWWEAVMVRLWATGVVSFVTFDDMMADKQLLAQNIAWLLIIPVWRDMHFYIAHRFLHIRSVYTYVHKLHHRNADPEPFSGMTMHPIEHLYYFSNAFTPSLYLSNLSPIIFTWNFIHLTIAPGAGHSGWEDHFQADQYHYVHHKYFECNYGSPMSGCIDQMLGTFREKLGTSKAYTGEWNEKNDDNVKASTSTTSSASSSSSTSSTPSVGSVKKAKEWSPHGYLGLPASWDHGVYTLFWAALFPLMWYSATDAKRVEDMIPLDFNSVPFTFAEFVAAIIAYTPVPVAMALSVLSGDKMSWRWPFQKERVFGVFGIFLIFGWAACILPIYHATLWLLQIQA